MISQIQPDINAGAQVVAPFNRIDILQPAFFG